MRRSSPVTEYAVRPYEETDETAVLDLLRATLGPGPGGERSPDFFRWKHLQNPFGRSLMLVAEEEGRIIGLRAFMRWRFRAGERVIEAGRPVDTATHPDAQGRGVFSRLTEAGLLSLGGSASVLFNTPNEKSLPGYLKLGWRTVAPVPISVKIRRPVRFATRIRSFRSAGARPTDRAPRIIAERASQVLSRSLEISDLLEATARSSGLSTPRTLDYLRWRYASAPLLDYRAAARYHYGELAGLAIFRVRPRGGLWESTIAEILVRDGDAAMTKVLLRDVAQAASSDILTLHAPTGSLTSRIVRRAGFLRAPIGMTFVVHALEEGLTPDPTDPDSWALSLGDLEVF